MRSSWSGESSFSQTRFGLALRWMAATADPSLHREVQACGSGGGESFIRSTRVAAGLRLEVASSSTLSLRAGAEARAVQCELATSGPTVLDSLDAAAAAAAAAAASHWCAFVWLPFTHIHTRHLETGGGTHVVRLVTHAQ